MDIYWCGRWQVACTIVFATQYSDHKAVPVLFYSAATLVGISRLTEHEYWGSDVFVGALLGYLSGKQVVNYYNKTRKKSLSTFKSERKNWREIMFTQYRNQLGISIIW